MNPTIFIRIGEKRYAFEELDMRVSQNGYVFVSTPGWWNEKPKKYRELLLTFSQMEAALQEERDLWQ